MAPKARVHYPGPERCRSAEPGTGRGNGRAPRLKTDLGVGTC